MPGPPPLPIPEGLPVPKLPPLPVPDVAELVAGVVPEQAAQHIPFLVAYTTDALAGGVA